MGGQPAPKDLKIAQKDLLIFFRQLAVILQSGVSLAQGMNLIAENMTNKKLAHCIQRIAARLSAGEELSTSLKQYPKVFKPITVGLIEAGEAGGILDQVLDRIALLMEEQAKIRGQIIGALVYPALVFLLSISVSLGLLIFVVPKFKAMFDGMGADLPALTSFMLTLSNLVTSIQFAIGAPLVIAGLLYGFKSIYSSKTGRLKIDTAIFRVPLFGDLILRSEMAGMCDTLATLVNSGIPIVDGLDRCANASSNERIRVTIRRGINFVMQGQELNYSLNQSKVFPKLVISMIKIGEETGQLSFMLEKLAIFYKREVESIVSSLTKAMEPAVIFVVAGIVGTIVVSLYLPMFSLIQKFGK
ncbi:type II secretion system F family protein [Synechococcus sp. BS55D]|uniref:type II secretion system F family protein n=1 Tax=Synechococcus sp. BS55D TaxID=2055943 RepID=UPI00103C12B6|nr:type II secretion system F family protein [Synechococcus sp. BS55D]TCD57861.1 type II secretion system F family protein [Synechococcus sp. BS55D]